MTTTEPVFCRKLAVGEHVLIQTTTHRDVPGVFYWVPQPSAVNASAVAGTVTKVGKYCVTITGPEGDLRPISTASKVVRIVD